MTTAEPRDDRTFLETRDDRIFVEWDTPSAYISSLTPDFVGLFGRLVAEYGPPARVEFRAHGEGWVSPPPVLALCPDCIAKIGGANPGPDAEWVPCTDGEPCEAADHDDPDPDPAKPTAKPTAKVVAKVVAHGFDYALAALLRGEHVSRRGQWEEYSTAYFLRDDDLCLYGPQGWVEEVFNGSDLIATDWIIVKGAE